MSIVASDVLYKLSTKNGSAGNTTAGTSTGSLGKYVSTTTVSNTALNNLFDDVTGSENVANTVEYRCLFVLNNHASLTMQSTVVYLSAQTAGGTNMALAIDNIGASAKGSSSAQADSIANETTAPTAVGAFSTPTTAGAGLSLGDIAPGQVRAFWLRRTAANSVALNADGGSFTVSFVTNY